ncbi:adenylate/guanylate cyclase domain-containing protein [Streptacidiphilus rugosus]|uniref:adenylate/guanylate cyclase domain-containing protein n=1 Tax=Streptacidiphilus rugosus TaxID=405783 RepID=UPI00055D9649|nr:adenylate/guanylate cyclase domain-containing protein [Streptacidiphilus rugosus]
MFEPDGAAAERRCGTCGTVPDATSRFCAMCGASLSAGGQVAELRRHVVVLFADLEGFTAISEGLDPEVLRAVMDRYFRLCSQVIWNHGGTTEKFIGDAVMAVFGIPVAREDDALRAARAGLEIITELGALNAELGRDYGIGLKIRIGVHAGPVSASYDTFGDFRIVGDTVNTASRLQSAAQAGELLLGESTAQVVRPHMALEEVPPLRVKGKEAPLRAWRVLSASPDAAAVGRTVRLIGRDFELTQLEHTYRRTILRERGCLVTLLGPPGIGKSRLATEFEGTIGGAAPTVLRGHARSYGKGVTYRPVAEMLESAAAGWAAFQLRGETDPEIRRAVGYLSTVLRTPARGAADEGAHGAEVRDIAWALRVFFGSLAERGPLLLVWEDLHWAEPTLLDVVEYLCDELSDFPVMHLCVARPELLESRTSWSGGQAGTMVLELLPLTEQETAELVLELAADGEVAAQDLDDVCRRVAESCEGNPLFAELMLDVVGEAPDNPTPATIQAMLAARLDRLPTDERLVLEMAAVAGREFTAGAARSLLDADERSDTDLGAVLDRLRRGRLVIGRGASEPYRFAQALVRDTAYELTAKRHRLRWHLVLAAGIERRRLPEHDGHLAEPADLDDLGYHLEAAWGLARELHPNGAATRDVADRAAAVLTAQAAVAMDRKDLPAAVSLLERAHEILPSDAPGHLELVLRLSDGRLALQDREGALGAVAADPGGADDVRQRRLGLEIQRHLLELGFGARTPAEILAAEAELERDLLALGAGDLLWCRFHQLRANRHLMQERIGAAEESLRCAERAAAGLPDDYELDRVRRTVGELALWGPTPVSEGLERCRQLADAVGDSRVSLVPILAATAGLLGLAGRQDEAWQAWGRANEYAQDLRLRSADIGLAHVAGVIASMGGDHRTAFDHFDRVRGVLEAAGQAEGALLLEAYAACASVALGEPVPRRFADMSEAEVEAVGDPRTGPLAAVLRARAELTGVGAGAGTPDLDLARSLCERARSLLLTRMEDPYFQGTVLEDVAELLDAVGARQPALEAAAEALDRHRSKGAVTGVERAERLLVRLGAETAS